MKFARPTRCYAGTKAWAEAHAARLQGRVGGVADGMTVSAVVAAPYGSSRRKWGVRPILHYTGNPALGNFEGAYVMLPVDL